MRPSSVRLSCRRGRLRLALILFTLAFPLGWVSYKALMQPHYPDLARWDLDQIEHHLRDHGLQLRRVDPTRMPPMVPSMFLTRTDKSWDQLERVPKSLQTIDDWQGTVYCERRSDPEGRANQAAVWESGCLQAGPYLFFGDRTLLAEIHLALQTPARPEPRYPGSTSPQPVQAV